MHSYSRTRYAIVGALLGFIYGQYRVYAAVAHMKERWGWVCGTGLEFTLWFWSIIGALIGIGFGVASARYQSRN